jgi:hypothetical protein
VTVTGARVDGVGSVGRRTACLVDGERVDKGFSARRY